MEIKLPNEIWIDVEGRHKLVLTSDYIKAKTAQLKEFGYSDLTEQTVEGQLKLILSGKPLNVIGKFIEDDIVKEK